MTTGSSSAEFGNAKSGIISITTKTGGPNYQGSLRLRDRRAVRGEPQRRAQPVEGSFSGPLAGRLTFALSGTLEGRKAIEDGFNSQDTPIFLQAGIDTVVRQASTVDRPATRRGRALRRPTRPTCRCTTSRSSRGRASRSRTRARPAFGGDADYIQKIRNNFGLSCEGRAAAGNGDGHSITASGKLNYSYGTGSRVCAQPAAPAGMPVTQHSRRRPSGTTTCCRCPATSRDQPAEPHRDTQLDPEPVQERRAGAGAGRGALVPAGQDDRRPADGRRAICPPGTPSAGSSSSRCTSCSTSTTSRSPTS